VGNENPSHPDVTADNWNIGVLDQVDASGCDGTWTQATRDSIKLSEPMPFIYTTTHTARRGYEKVLDYVGASLHRDSFDEMIISDTRYGRASHTGSGLSQGFINSQNDNKPSGAGSDWSAWPTLVSTEAPLDTDQDGMPDDWETANGLDPNNKNDYNTLNEDGYTMLEVYINSLVADITASQNEDGEPQGYILRVGEAQYSEYEISGQTSNGDWTFSGGFKMNQTGTPATGSYATIKYSANRQYKLTLPVGLEFSSVDFYGYANADGGSSYLSEVNGTAYTASDYAFPARDAQPGTITHSVTFSEPIANTLTFTVKGSQTCLKLTLYVNQATGIHIVDNGVITTHPNSMTIYTLQGVPVKGSRRGLYIQNGRKYLQR
jgi:hypothetical protein